MNEIDMILLIISGLAGTFTARYDRKILSYLNEKTNFYYTETYILDDVIVEYHLFWDRLHFSKIYRNAGCEMGFGSKGRGK